MSNTLTITLEELEKLEQAIGELPTKIGFYLMLILHDIQERQQPEVENSETSYGRIR